MESKHILNSELGRRDLLRRGGVAAAALASSSFLASCSSSSSSSRGGGGSSKKIRVWWDKGYYPAEGESVKAAIKAWEKSSGKTAELTLLATDSFPGKMTAAVQAGNPPEVAFGNVIPTAIYARDDVLADCTDVVKSAQLTDSALKGGYMYNAKKDSSAYYGVPLGTTTTMLFHWKSMLQEVGVSEPLPTGWNDFWQVFKDAQKSYRAKKGGDTYGIGWTLSSGSEDTNEMIRFALMSFGVDLITDDMRLNRITGDTRRGMTEAIAWLADLYKDGFIPKDSISWASPDNNAALLNHNVFMTPNSSLSIPAAIKEDKPKEWAELVTTGWPDRKVGGSMPQVSEPWNACVFRQSGNPDAGKDFLKFFMQPDVINDWLVAAQARRVPVDKRVLQKPYWSQSKDPNVTAVLNALSGPKTVPAWLISSAPYQNVVTSGMWGKVLGKAAIGQQTPKEAADFAITTLTGLFEKAHRVVK